jgi:uncharacterized membrane protein
MTGSMPTDVKDDETDGLAVDLDAPDDHQLAGGARRGLATLLTAGGAIGFVASFVLTAELIRLLEDPAYVPSCSFNPVLSCGSVMQTWQAGVLGFANTLAGIAAFAVVTTIGVVLLAGAALPRWFWLGLEAGTIAGTVFVHWLIYQSLYEIGALCPYCMVVWIVTVPIFWYVTAHLVQAGHIRASARVRRVLVRNGGPVLVLWFLALTVLILVRFWDYWSTLV